jgi:hypothetical protein
MEAIVTIEERPLGCFVSFSVSLYGSDEVECLDPPIDLAGQLLGLSPFGSQRGKSIEFFPTESRGQSQAMYELLRPIDKLLRQHGIKSINYQRTINADSLLFAGLE